MCRPPQWQRCLTGVIEGLRRGLHVAQRMSSRQPKRSPRHPDYSHETPFWKLCWKGDLEGVRVAIRRGDNINQLHVEFGMTGLIWAVWNNHLGVVQLLLDQPSINVNLQNNCGMTALHHCVFSGKDNLGALRLLVASPSLMLNVLDDLLMSPLMAAVYWGSTNCARELLKLDGVEKEIRDADGRSLEEVAR